MLETRTFNTIQLRFLPGKENEWPMGGGASKHIAGRLVAGVRPDMGGKFLSVTGHARVITVEELRAVLQEMGLDNLFGEARDFGM